MAATFGRLWHDHACLRQAKNGRRHFSLAQLCFQLPLRLPRTPISALFVGSCHLQQLADLQCVTGALGSIRAYELRVGAETWNWIALALLMFGDPSLTFCRGRAAQARRGGSFEGLPILSFQGSTNIELRCESISVIRHGKNMTSLDRFGRSLSSAMTSAPVGGKKGHNNQGGCAA